LLEEAPAQRLDERSGPRLCFDTTLRLLHDIFRVRWGRRSHSRHVAGRSFTDCGGNY